MGATPRFEQLEPRLALAAVLQYIDIDGDLVTVKTSRGSENDLTTALVFSAAATNVRRQLQMVDLVSNPTVFGGTALAITVKKAGDGDGLAAVGRIRATDINLGPVTIQGDLGQIEAGSGIQAVPALVSLAVDSLGRYGIGTGAASNRSRVDGRIEAIKVRRDVAEATFEAGSIGKVTIGGSLIGGDTDRSGLIEAGGTIGTVSIGGSILGGAGESSGQIASTTGSLNSVTVRGSLVGGAGNGSGTISAQVNIGSVNVQGDLIGSTGQGSGAIGSPAPTETTRRISIGGSVVGGSGSRSGSIRIGLINPTRVAIVEVRGDVRGGAGTRSGALTARTFGRLSIGGSLIGGDGDISASVGEDIGVFSVETTTIDSLSIGGSVVGGAGSSSGSVIAASRLGVASIGGSVVGGDGFRSGRVESGAESGERFTVGQSIVGGTGNSSGSVQVAAKTVFVGGSLIGGSQNSTGTLVVLTGRAAVKGSVVGGSGKRSGRCVIVAAENLSIGGDLVGGAGEFSGTVNPGAAFVLNTEIGQVSIGGSVFGGPGQSSGSIAGETSIKLVSIRGNVTGQRGNPVLIAGTSSTGASLGRITVGGAVSETLILAGYRVGAVGATVDPVNPAAIIGSVSIGGNLQRSSIVAGVQNVGFPNFGDDDDRIIPSASLPPFRGTIQSVTIGGVVTGSDDPLQKFGIVAFEMGSVKVGGLSIPLPEPGGIIPLGISRNVHLHILS